MRIINFFLLISAAVLFSFTACENKDMGTPKPRTYPRVEFPVKEYTTFRDNNCHFEFEYPVYGVISKEKTYFDSVAPNDCWYNLFFKSFNGTLYLTYYPISGKKDFDKLINDSYDLVSKHNIKAVGRSEIPLELINSGGMLFRIEGNVASQTQFFITDSTRNFIRGSLYFNTRVNTDSMQIIQEFIDKDIDHLISSFKWIK